MKYLITIILGMLLSFSVFASPNLDAPTDDKPIIPAPEDKPKQYLPIMIQCDAADKSLEIMEKFNEEPFITGIFQLVLPSGQVIQQPGAVYMNPAKGTVSVVVGFTEAGKICHILNGSEFGPAVSQGSFLKS